MQPAYLAGQLLKLIVLLVIIFACSTGKPTEELPQLLETARNDIRAHVSPDGLQIAFSTRDDSSRTNYGFYVIGVDGKGLKQLLFDDRLSIKAPKWSPDGSKIAFAKGEGQEIDIFTIQSEGGELLQVTDGPGVDAEPSWSPDGSELIFHSNRSGNFQLYRMDENGQNQRKLIESDANDYIPDWSINNKIAFTSDRAGTTDLWMVNEDGTELTQLTSYEGREIAPVWSSDGSKLSFHRNTPAIEGNRTWNWDVYLMEPGKTEVRRITKDPGEDLFATWFPNGTQLLIPSQRGATGLFRFYSVEVGDTAAPLKFEPIPIYP